MVPGLSNRICSQDQHAQAQPWLRHAQAQLVHAQHWPKTLSCSRQGGAALHPLPCSHQGPRQMLSIDELSLSMPEPMLSLSMLILATTCVLSQRDGFRQPYSNFSNRQYPLAQNRGTNLMGIAVWRVAENPKIAIFVRNIVRHVRNVRNVRIVRNISHWVNPLDKKYGYESRNEI